MTREQIEAALATGHVWAAMRNGRYWRLHRNGATQRWKTRPFAFRIPVKAGLKAYGEITHDSSVAYMGSGSDKSADFIVTIGDLDPNS